MPLLIRSIVELLTNKLFLKMKTTTKFVYALTGLLMSGLVLSCSDNEDVQIVDSSSQSMVGPVDEQLSDHESSCSYVDGNWSSSANLYTSLPNSGSTSGADLLVSQNTAIKTFWRGSSVAAPLFRFVRDLSNPSSTFNAISYSNGKIYFGEEIYKWAKNRDGSNLINVMILAHEYGHQLQYAYGLPSRQENTVRAGELEADGMAGYYLRRGYGKSSFAAIATAYEAAYAIGDYDTNSGGHHGTPAQRKSAVRLGFLFADPQNPKLTAPSFDSNFFYYYNGVLNGSYRMARPSTVTPEFHAFMLSHMEELGRIANGQMSDEEYKNL